MADKYKTPREIGEWAIGQALAALVLRAGGKAVLRPEEMAVRGTWHLQVDPHTGECTITVSTGATAATH